MQPSNVTKVIAAFDKTQGDGRTSELKDVVSHEGRHLVFIRRAEHPDLILRQGKIIHGHKPEWIIVDFADDAKTVNISSVSVSVPLEHFQNWCRESVRARLQPCRKSRAFMRP